MTNSMLVLAANQRYYDGDGIDDEELDALIDHYTALYKLISLQIRSLKSGDMYRLFELDIMHGLNQLERFKMSRDERKREEN